MVDYIIVKSTDSKNLYVYNNPANFTVRIPEIKLDKKYNYFLGLINVSFTHNVLKKGKQPPLTLTIYCNILKTQIEFSNYSDILRRFPSGFKKRLNGKEEAKDHLVYASFRNVLYVPLKDFPSITDMTFEIFQNDVEYLNFRKSAVNVPIVLCLHLKKERKDTLKH